MAPAQSYVRDVYPIWEKYCLGCHASGTRMGSLDIETWEGLQRGGNHGTILVPGNLKASRLYTMLIGEGAPAMPMDGKVLSAAEIDVVRKWIASGATPPTAGEIALLKQRAAGEEPNPIFSLAWRPGTLEIAVGRTQTVDLLHPDTKQIRATLRGHAGPVRALAFSSDGRRLAAAGGQPGRPGEVLIWDTATQSIVARIASQRDAIDAVAFSPDRKRIATASFDHAVKLWDAATGREIRTLKGGTGGVTALALSPDGGRLAAAGVDKSIRIWSVDDDAAALVQSSAPLPDAIIALTWSPDGRWLACSGADKSLQLLNAADLSVTKSLPGQSDLAYGLAFSPDNLRLAVGRMDGSVSLVAR